MSLMLMKKKGEGRDELDAETPTGKKMLIRSTDDQLSTIGEKDRKNQLKYIRMQWTKMTTIE